MTSVTGEQREALYLLGERVVEVACDVTEEVRDVLADAALDRLVPRGLDVEEDEPVIGVRTEDHELE